MDGDSGAPPDIIARTRPPKRARMLLNTNLALVGDTFETFESNVYLSMMGVGSALLTHSILYLIKKSRISLTTSPFLLIWSVTP